VPFALLWQGWKLVEEETRVARYRAAYAAQPDTPEERAFAGAAAAELLSGGETWESGD
jgi:hypothetical protein